VNSLQMATSAFAECAKSNRTAPLSGTNLGNEFPKWLGFEAIGADFGWLRLAFAPLER